MKQPLLALATLLVTLAAAGCGNSTEPSGTGGAGSGGHSGNGGAPGSGGRTGGGGVVGGGGSVGNAGGRTAKGGAPGTGGAQATGGSNASGGVAGSGGSVGNAGGSTANGGAQATGGSNASGGVAGNGGSVGNAGGSTANGGAPATGGSNGSGGVVGSGGSVGNAGGSTANGGAQATGGSNRSGGVVGSGGASGTGETSASKCPAGWNLAWSDEFDGPAGTAANGNNLVYETGNNNGWGNNELEYYQAGNANGALDGDGNFVITSKKETVGGFNYTSARLKTQGKHDWTYGHFEARIKIPSGQGMWPAFWMMGSTGGNWPACGEIDIMESLGKEPNIVHGTMHGPGYSGAQGPTASTTMPGPAKLADDFHVFAVEWETNVIRWYFDGQLYSTKTPADIGAGNTWVFDHPFYFLINNAVGGGWPGNPDATTVFPQEMTIDYVRVCQR